MLHKLGERIDRCAAEIDSRNRRNLVVFSNGALLVSFIVFLASLIWPYYRALLLSHGILSLYSAFLFFCSRYIQQRRLRYIRLFMYLAFAPIMTAGVLLGSFFDPSRAAVSIVIFLCILPLFIIDKPWRIIAYQLFFAAAFVVCSFLSKTPEIFREDVFYLPIYLALGIGANIFTMYDKIESAENCVRSRRESEHDPLTELYNRKSGEEKIKSLFRARVHGTFAILDIDNFKQINDSLGHQAGDAALCTVSDAVQKVFRSSDVVWRLGGDEFAVYAVNMLDADTCRSRFEALARRLAEAETPPYGKLALRTSVGCTICAGERLDFEAIYKSSDAALYEAKNAGKGMIVVRGAP